MKTEQKRELPLGTERILFVDDEPMIMKLGQRMLERQGYQEETRARKPGPAGPIHWNALGRIPIALI